MQSSTDAVASRPARRGLFGVGMIIAAALMATGCSTNPVSGKKDFVVMSEEQELALGRKVNGQIMQQYTDYENPALQAYVESLGEELATKSHRSNLVFRFRVLDDPSVNAFAVPGGYIYITRGILAYMQNEAQLAGVLGHEIGHVTARHSVRQQSKATLAGLAGAILAAKTGSRSVANSANVAAKALISGYGRSYELEADRLGAEYLARGGFDPDDMLDVVGILKDQENFEKARAQAEGREPRAYHGVFASHPRNDTRLQEVIGAAKSLEGQGGTRGKDSEAFLRKLEGMDFGTSTDQGVLRGRNFYHRDLDLHIKFPDGWRVENKPSTLEAISPENDEVIVISVQDQNRREPPREFLERQVKRLKAGERLRDVDGYAGIAQMQTKRGVQNGRVAAVYEGDKIYLLKSVHKTREPSRNNLLATANSIRSLRSNEQRLAEARKIRLHRVKRGDTFASLARRSSLTNYAEEQLRVLNGMFPDGEPEIGQLIKVVD